MNFLRTIKQQIHARNIMYLIVITVVLVHLLIANTFDLGVDEAHYALYGKFLAWSYFDHPPMIGWLQAIAIALFGNSNFAIRLIPCLLYIGICTQLSSLTQHLTSNIKICLICIILFSISPLIQLLNFGLVPDYPLLLICLFIIKLLFKLDIQDIEHTSIRSWLLLGFLFGCAGLSKYNAVFFGLGVCGYWVGQGKILSYLGSYKFYSFLVVAILTVSPVFIWNYQHDWISFRYQLHHATGGIDTLSNVIVSHLTQEITYSIVIVFGGIVASIYMMSLYLRKIPAIELHTKLSMEQMNHFKLLLWLAWPYLLFMAYNSSNGSSLPHWSLLGWITILPLTSYWIFSKWQNKVVRRFVYIGSFFSIIISVLLLYVLAMKALPFVKSEAGVRALIGDLVGWRQAGIQAVAIKTKLNTQLKASQSRVDAILVSYWTDASRIAWYIYPEKVVIMNPKLSQFTLWYGGVQAIKRGILVRNDTVSDDKEKQDRNKKNDSELVLSKYGFTCTFLTSQITMASDVRINKFSYYDCVK